MHVRCLTILQQSRYDACGVCGGARVKELPVILEFTSFRDTIKCLVIGALFFSQKPIYLVRILVILLRKM